MGFAPKDVALVVPTLNAGSKWKEWLYSFSKQTFKPQHLIIIDSSSMDNTVELARQEGFNITIIAKHEFNHGGTRQLAVSMISKVEIIVFLTQDAILANVYSLEKLLNCFENNQIGAAYGRQLPNINEESTGFHARLFNYPDESKIKSVNDASSMGIKTAFISNSFAAYRTNSLLGVGGFPKRTILGEDTYVAAKMLLAGWKIAYCAEAQVYHSHNYSFFQEFKRYFDIGVFHSRESWIREKLGQAEGEGLRFVLSEFRFVLSKGKWYLIPSIFIRTVLKYLGYRLGIREKNLPFQWKKYFSMHKQYWDQE